MSDYIRILVKPNDPSELPKSLVTQCDNDVYELDFIGVTDRIELHENATVEI